MTDETLLPKLRGDAARKAVVARWTAPTRRPLFSDGDLVDTWEDPPLFSVQGDVLNELGWSIEKLKGFDGDADQVVAEALGISLFQSILLRVVDDKKAGCPEDVLCEPEKVLGDHAQACLAFGRHLDRMTPADWIATRTSQAADGAFWDAYVKGKLGWFANRGWFASRAAKKALAGGTANEIARTVARVVAGDAAWGATGDNRSAWAVAREAAEDAAWRRAYDAAWIDGSTLLNTEALVAKRASEDAAGAVHEIQGARSKEAIANGWSRRPVFFLPLFGFESPEAVLEADARLDMLTSKTER